ncbi:MAG: disulfide bond formation protein DsbA [Caulobacter sp.]|nr:disulfide bond formation protein DsbA [Caulobacter sp.]
MRRARPLAPVVGLMLAAAALALAGCGPEKHDDLFGARVRAYLLNHPEILVEMSDKLQAKAAKDAEAEADKALALGRQALAKPEIRKALEHDSRDYVANPGGRITVTEFYDYRCPHCVNMAPAVMTLIHDNPDVRFVFKEMPIFGATSDRAALAAIAIHRKGGDVMAAHRAFMAAHPLTDAGVDQVLHENGIDPASIDTDEARNQLKDIKKLAVNLGANGTPTFVVGDTIIPGEGERQLMEAIAQARGK